MQPCNAALLHACHPARPISLPAVSAVDPPCRLPCSCLAATAGAGGPSCLLPQPHLTSRVAAAVSRLWFACGSLAGAAAGPRWLAGSWRACRLNAGQQQRSVALGFVKGGCQGALLRHCSGVGGEHAAAAAGQGQGCGLDWLGVAALRKAAPHSPAALVSHSPTAPCLSPGSAVARRGSMRHSASAWCASKSASRRRRRATSAPAPASPSLPTLLPPCPTWAASEPASPSLAPPCVPLPSCRASIRACRRASTSGVAGKAGAALRAR